MGNLERLVTLSVFCANQRREPGLHSRTVSVLLQRVTRTLVFTGALVFTFDIAIYSVSDIERTYQLEHYLVRDCSLPNVRPSAKMETSLQRIIFYFAETLSFLN
ncbi:unnamed protein product [Brugia pahangi]|uniref:G_PROTEIN_RECEP_F1_2 domain-containing protein n=1 Tax=Brugia pahangi TaxID=6280 RepID=A0A0N4SWT6_BRUPA|nr:unnamed protein product [Brugia pahangi]